MASIPVNERERILRVRAKGRTDLQFLCNEILHYPDVCREVHFPVLDIVQHFDDYQGRDLLLEDGTCIYQPRNIEPNQVIRREDGRRRLILDPRAFLKTTIQVMAHSIQWILNFPDIAILVIHAGEQKAIEILSEIKGHFTDNQTFRYYYPEYCPQTPSQIKNFGNLSQFTVPRRQKERKEPTISVGSVDKKLASSHYHVIKFTDVVEEQNATNEEQRAKVSQKYGLARSLLVDPHHWIDIEGTRYHMADLYGQIIRNQWFKIVDRKTRKERDRLPSERQWKMHIRGVYKKAGVDSDFTPDKLDAPYAYTETGDKISWWPTDRAGKLKFDLDTLEEMRNDPTTGEDQFAKQYLNNPLDTSTEKAFAINKIVWVNDELNQKIRPKFHITSIDTASTLNVTSNDSCITTCKWDEDDRQVCVEVSLDKYLPHELIQEIFFHVMKYKPIAVYIEETEYVRGFKPQILRMQEKLNVWPEFVFIKRETTVSKVDRILKTLQPPFKHKRLMFLESLPEHIKERLKVEMSEFPLGAKDDLLDTLADQYQERDEFTGRVAPKLPTYSEEDRQRLWRKWLRQEGIDEIFGTEAMMEDLVAAGNSYEEVMLD